MKRKAMLLSVMVMTAVTGLSAVESKKATSRNAAEIGPGAYQATVKAIVCDGCGEFIQKTMASQSGIGVVVVDQKAKLVTFRVNDGAKIKVANLQKALAASAEQMGMGADYTLHNIKKVAGAQSVVESKPAPVTPPGRDEHQGHQH